MSAPDPPTSVPIFENEMLPAAPLVPPTTEFDKVPDSPLVSVQWSSASGPVRVFVPASLALIWNEPPPTGRLKSLD